MSATVVSQCPKCYIQWRNGPRMVERGTVWPKPIRHLSAINGTCKDCGGVTPWRTEDTHV